MGETVVATHADNWGIPEYTIKLTFTYHQESEHWVGVCTELGTSAFAETREQMQAELRDAVELQLNEVTRIADVTEYLADNDVEIVPSKLPKQAGFAIA